MATEQTSAPVGHTDPLDEYRAKVRADGFMLTPYRLGLAVGRANAFTPSRIPKNPYRNARGRRCYEDGVRFGIEWAKRDAREGGAK